MEYEPIFEDGKLVGYREVQAAQAPQPAPQPEPQSEEGAGFFSEAGRAVVGGVRDGVQELGETVQWAGESLGNALTGGSDVYWTEEEGFEWLTQEEVKSGKYTIPEWQTRDLFGVGGTVSLPEVAPNETMVGGFTRGAVQFVTGYAAVSRSLGLARAATKTGAVVQGLGVGAVTDFATFDAHEDRFSDFLRDNVGLQDRVTEYLASSADDTILSGKLKNAIEGAGLGVATEFVFRAVKLFKKAKKVQIEQGDGAAAEVMNDGLAEIAEKEPEVLQLDLFDASTDPNMGPQAAGAGPEKVIGGKQVDTPQQPVKAADEAAEASGDVTTANAEAKGVNLGEKGPTINTKALQEQLDYEIGLRRAGSIADPERIVDGKLFNFGRIDSDLDVKDVLNMATDSIAEYGFKDRTTFAEISKEATEWVADYVDVSPEVVMQSLRRQAADAERQQALVVAAKQIQLSLSREIDTLAEKIAMGNATDAERVLFVRRQQQLVETAGLTKSVIRGAAQTTSAGRIITSDVVTGQQLAAADIAKQIGDSVSHNRDKIDRMAKAVVLNSKAKGGSKGVLKIAERSAASLARKGMDAVNEFYINSILSGPKTHMINILSNAMNTLLMPAEKVIGGAISADKASVLEGFRQYNGMRMAIFDSLKMAGVALREGRNILDPEAAILEANGADFRAIRSQSENPVINLAINGLGNFIRLPSRALMGGDELFKQLNYRSNLYARLTGEAGQLVLDGKISKDEAAAWVQRRMETAFDRNSGAAKSELDLEYARETTFTQALRRDSTLGSLASDVQNMTNKHPVLKLVLPFVRTPANIMKATLQRTPVLQFMSKTLREDLTSGVPSRVASARGKIATGVMVYSAAAFLAAEGKITGSGPRDPALRARLMETGWRPFSYKREKADGTVEYVEYRRMEPFGTYFGIVADIVEISDQADEMEMMELSATVATAFANNVASKTFLRGIVDAVEAFNDPERYARSYFLNYASAMVPQSSFMRELRKAQDPIMRDVRNFTDAIRNTLPAFSESIPARRSWVTGEPIVYPKGWDMGTSGTPAAVFGATNPIAAGIHKDDPVLDEMARLNFSFSAPTRKIKGVDLTEAEYSRYLELHGTVKIGRRTLHEALAATMEKQSYDKDRERFGDDFDPAMSKRVQAFQKVISRYRERAQIALMRENPELNERVQQRRIEERDARRAGFTGIANIAQ